ncbi:UxaA family hydrolase [Poseidonocella sp. HB161398]|uniref:UxaA family hydrolase n=1 Tax=Poseidonocella sp. HB161398 TaxID=2320855 RepID=UPI001F0D9639|nr:altronate dehydratase family protein [Poseidonocella sp. HB161398]
MTQIEAADRVIRIHHEDDVGIARQRIEAGTPVGGIGPALAAIPAGHKIALRALEAGSPVRRYGQVIGHATAPIAAGAHVHVHNLDIAGTARAAEIGSARKGRPAPAPARVFDGILRPDGRVATRNYIGILTTVNCSAHVAELVASVFARNPLTGEDPLADYPNVDGVVALTHKSGCGMSAGAPLQLLRRTLGGYARHPNFSHVLVFGLGCEVNQIGGFVEAERLAGRLASLDIQGAGGARAAVARGVALVSDCLAESNRAARVPVPASALKLALICGGSDSYSGLTANPALGAAADLLVAQGGTAILSETPETWGAEHLLAARAARPEVGEALLERIRWWEAYARRHDVSLNANPTPGNKAGGLTTILEKSLGALAKGGTTDLEEVVGYAEPVTRPGLVFMDGPGYDPVQVTGQIASGANLVAFTTGRGSVFGAKPAPTLKLASNSAMYRRMQDDMDIDCGTVLEGRESIADCGARIFEALLATASGRPTASETMGFGGHEFAPWQTSAAI